MSYNAFPNCLFFSFVVCDSLCEMGPGVLFYLYFYSGGKIIQGEFVPLREILSVFSFSFFHMCFTYVYGQ